MRKLINLPGSHGDWKQYALCRNQGSRQGLIHSNCKEHVPNNDKGLHLMKCLAQTQGDKVRVNAVLPGLLLTDWVSCFLMVPDILQ